MNTTMKRKRLPVGSCYDAVKTVTRHWWDQDEFGFAANISKSTQMLFDYSISELGDGATGYERRFRMEQNRYYTCDQDSRTSLKAGITAFLSGGEIDTKSPGYGWAKAMRDAAEKCYWQYGAWCNGFSFRERLHAQAPVFPANTVPVSEGMSPREVAYQFVQLKMREAYAIAWRDAVTKLKARFGDSVMVNLSLEQPYEIIVTSPFSLTVEIGNIMGLVLEQAKTVMLGKDAELRPCSRLTYMFKNGKALWDKER